MREDSENLLIQAGEDLDTAGVLLDASRYYARPFFSQQAAEQALKALYQEVRRRHIHTHNLARISEQLDAPEEIQGAANELTPDYLVTRYPNAVGGVPAQLYSQRNAEKYFRLSPSIVSWVKQRLQNRENT